MLTDEMSVGEMKTFRAIRSPVSSPMKHSELNPALADPEHKHSTQTFLHGLDQVGLLVLARLTDPIPKSIVLSSGGECTTLTLCIRSVCLSSDLTWGHENWGVAYLLGKRKGAAPPSHGFRPHDFSSSPVKIFEPNI